MIAYIDSSVLLRIVLGQPNKLSEWRSIEQGVTSALTEVECLRTLDGMRLRAGLSEEEIATRREATYRFLEAIDEVELGSAVRTRATQPFPVELGTLDAIHLATALLWKERTEEALVLATHDRALALAARASGFGVVGV